MSYKLIWRPQAKLTLTQNMDYLVKEWDNKVLFQFMEQVESALKKIKQNPHSYPLHRFSDDIRRFKVNKRVELYYRLINE